MKPFHLFSKSGDCYEVVLRGHVIVRITLYTQGAQASQEVEYDHAPEEVKVGILNEVAKALEDGQ